METKTGKTAELEQSMLTNFTCMVDEDKEATEAMKTAMKKVQPGKKELMDGKILWQQFQIDKHLLVNEMMSPWINNEQDALDHVWKEVWAASLRKQLKAAAKKKWRPAEAVQWIMVLMLNG